MLHGEFLGRDKENGKKKYAPHSTNSRPSRLDLNILRRSRPNSMDAVLLMRFCQGECKYLYFSILAWPTLYRGIETVRKPDHPIRYRPKHHHQPSVPKPYVWSFALGRYLQRRGRKTNYVSGKYLRRLFSAIRCFLDSGCLGASAQQRTSQCFCGSSQCG